MCLACLACLLCLNDDLLPIHLFGYTISYTYMKEVGRLQYMLGIIYSNVCSLPTDVLSLFSLPPDGYTYLSSCLSSGEPHLFFLFISVIKKI